MRVLQKKTQRVLICLILLTIGFSMLVSGIIMIASTISGADVGYAKTVSSNNCKFDDIYVGTNSSESHTVTFRPILEFKETIVSGYKKERIRIKPCYGGGYRTVETPIYKTVTRKYKDLTLRWTDIKSTVANPFNSTNPTVKNPMDVTVTPSTNLPKGTHSATLSVYGKYDNIGRTLSGTFTFTITVKDPPPPVYGRLSINPSSINFPSIERNGTVPGQQTSVLTYSGSNANQASGTLKVEFSGDHTSFDWTNTGTGSISLGGTRSITVKPKANLNTAPKNYQASVTFSGTNNSIGSVTLYVSFQVRSAPPGMYQIALSQSPTWPSVAVNYAQPAAQSLTVTNTGTQPTGQLSLASSGTNFHTSLTQNGTFNSTEKKMSSIAVGGTATFWVRPVTGLGAGNHNGSVTVSNDDVGSHSRNLLFSVGAGTYGITLSESPVFDVANVGYSQPAGQQITITNTGNQATGVMTLQLNDTDFHTSLTQTGTYNANDKTINSIAASGTATFWIRPKTQLSTGNYSASVSVGNTSVGFPSRTVTFKVVSYGVTLSGNHDFESRDFNYTTPPQAYYATIANSGTQPSGALTVEISGANTASFRFNGLQTTTIPITGGIQTESVYTITIQPITGLSAGEHKAVLTLKPGQGNTNIKGEQKLTVTFFVRSYGIEANPTTIDYGTKNAGYAAQNTTVTVTNKGNQPTGNLIIENPNPNIFEVSTATNPASIASLSGRATFTVKLLANKPSGIHSSRIRVGNTVTGWAYIDVLATLKAPNISISLSGDPSEGDTAIIGGDTGKGDGAFIGADGNVKLGSSGAYIFPARDFGYTTPPKEYTVSLKNSGDQATGTLQVTLTNAMATNNTGGTPINGANSFTLSGSAVTSIPVNGVGSFSIRPKPSLAAGTHAATVTLTGSGVFMQFDVKFTVRLYDIELDQTSFTFSSVDVFDFYDSEECLVTISNTGNQPTGALKIELAKIAGTTPNSFSLSKNFIPDIAVNGTATFVIQPQLDLDGGRHTATITVSGEKTPTRTVTVSFFLKELNISLDPATDYEFPTVEQGYNPSMIGALTVTIRNTGNDSTGELFIELWGTSSSSFAVSRDTIPSIPEYGKASFTVIPKAGLPGGTHSMMLMVVGDAIPSKGFNVTFRVESKGLSLSRDYVFPSMDVDYETPPTYTVTVTNTGDEPTGELSIEILGEDWRFFELSKDSIPSLLVKGQKETFVVQPAMHLMSGPPYFATVLVRNGTSINDCTLATQINFAFTVNYYEITLSHSELHLRPAAENFTASTAMNVEQNVAVYNTGTADTGMLNIEFIDGDIDCFILSRTSISNIPVGAFSAFLVRPIVGLKAGAYSVVIKIGSEKIEGEYVEVIFLVGGYGVLLSQAGLFTFAFEHNKNYASEQLDVIITNTGDLATGPLYLWLVGSDASAFSLSTKNLTSINYTHETATFNIKTARGLAPGIYTVTVEVRGNNIASQSFDITFTVYGYECPCDTSTLNSNYTPLIIIPAILGLLILLWLGSRKLPVPPQVQKSNKEDDKLVDLLLVTTASQAMSQPPHPAKPKSTPPLSMKLPTDKQRN